MSDKSKVDSELSQQKAYCTLAEMNLCCLLRLIGAVDYDDLQPHTASWMTKNKSSCCLRRASGTAWCLNNNCDCTRVGWQKQSKQRIAFLFKIALMRAFCWFNFVWMLGWGLYRRSCINVGADLLSRWNVAHKLKKNQIYSKMLRFDFKLSCNIVLHPARYFLPSQWLNSWILNT